MHVCYMLYLYKKLKEERIFWRWVDDFFLASRNFESCELTPGARVFLHFFCYFSIFQYYYYYSFSSFLTLLSYNSLLICLYIEWIGYTYTYMYTIFPFWKVKLILISVSWELQSTLGSHTVPLRYYFNIWVYIYIFRLWKLKCVHLLLYLLYLYSFRWIGLGRSIIVIIFILYILTDIIMH